MHSEYKYVQALASNRPRSSDVIAVFQREETLVVVVADGGCGLRADGAASQCLVNVVARAVDDPAFDLEETASWLDLFQVADEALAANGAGETSAVVVVLGPRGLVGIGAGDSEAWMVTATGADELTVGRRTKQRLGTGRVAPTVFERAALKGVLVVGSDGLFKFASSDVIARVIRNNAFAGAADLLIDLVRLHSGRMAEDTSVVLVREEVGYGRAS